MYNEDRMLGGLTEQEKRWVLNFGDLPDAYGVSRAYIHHGSDFDYDPTLSDAIRLLLWMLDHFESEEEKKEMIWKIWKDGKMEIWKD